MTHVAQAKENECLRADVQTLSTNIQILWEKFSTSETAQNERFEHMNREFHALSSLSTDAKPLSINSSNSQSCFQGVQQVVPLLSIQSQSPPKSSSRGVNVVTGEKLKISESAGSTSSLTRSALLTPLMLASASIGLPSKCSGKNSDWLAFRTQWEMWVQTMSVGDGSDDRLIFANLAKVLDDGEAANLLRLRNENPNLSFSAYWKGLVKEKERFLGENLKQALENLILETKGKMTTSKCKEYTSNFQRISSQIPHLSSEEAFCIILRQIPHYLAQRLQV